MNIVDFLKENTGVHRSTIKKFIRTAPHRYKKFQIKKRNSELKRDIAQPSKELKTIQKLILDKYELMVELPIHSAAKAYMKNIGIKDNAEVHKNNQYLLKMDFSNFFPSIKPEDLVSHLEKHRREILSDEDKGYVSSLFFYSKVRKESPVLSIGAPSSPYLSNTLMYDFDCRLSKECQEQGISYTRYADDLTFSTNIKDVLFQFPTIVEQILFKIPYPRLQINHGKTVFLSKRNNRHVTGLVISNEGRVSVGRKKKREIRSMLYLYKQGQLDPEKEGYLRGYIAFLCGIDKEFVQALEVKYQIDIKGFINFN